jgi:hypothetical protein
MIVKTFTADSVREALEKVRASFGPDAVILDTTFNRSGETRKGTSPRTVSITAAFEADYTPVPELEGKKTLHVADSLIEEPEAAPDMPTGNDTSVPVRADTSRSAESSSAGEHLAGLIQRLYSDVGSSLGMGHDGGIWRAWQQWLATQPELAHGIVDTFATHLVESLPPNEPFLEKRPKGQTVLFVGGRGSGKSTALFKCLAGRWQARERKPRLVTLSETDEHGQERLAAWCERCGIEFTTDTIARAGRLASFRRRQDDDLFVEYVPGAHTTSVEDSARRIRRGLKPDMVVQVLAATTWPASWRSDCTRFAAFTPSHLLVTHWDEMTPWWEIAALVREFRLAPTYRVGGFAPFAEYEPFSAVDWRSGIAARLTLAIGGRPEERERSRAS